LEQARKFLTVGYDRIYPLAPGVVLIKAPGHTPGGQMIYVRSEDGQEILLSGDVAWQKVGIDRGLQKPEGISAQLGEDREAIAQQLEWLRAVENEGVSVVVFHDLALIDQQIAQGVLGDGVEFR
jgi:glyoxylase-like metal-dependent hydrolase (beta-lactamase superfamily II)